MGRRNPIKPKNKQMRTSITSMGMLRLLICNKHMIICKTLMEYGPSRKFFNKIGFERSSSMILWHNNTPQLLLERHTIKNEATKKPFNLVIYDQ